MPDVTIHTEQEVDDLLRGLVLLGTGGGGHPQVGRGYLLPHIKAGGGISWTDLSNLPDDAWTCCVFGMGSVAPSEPLSETERERLGYRGNTIPYPMREAVQDLAAYTGVNIEALVPFEPGAVATTGPLDAATRLGIKTVDADYSGRAIPKLSQTLSSIAGHTLWPAAICDTWGNRLILKDAPSAEVAESLGKMISIVTKRPDPLAVCAHAGFLAQAGQMKQLVVPGTITLAYKVGTAIREARQSNQDPIKAAAGVLEGWMLFTGTITRIEWESRDGYMFGTTFIIGNGNFEGHTFKIWLQNENHITWLDDMPYVTSPDLIMVMDRETGEPYVNTVLAEGQQVAVLGAKNERYRNEEGLTALGPAHFGFDLPYRSIEALVS
ncbi:MAG: DUF917 domain-containing protein [Anaerolineae bacterium]